MYLQYLIQHLSKSGCAVADELKNVRDIECLSWDQAMELLTLVENSTKIDFELSTFGNYCRINFAINGESRNIQDKGVSKKEAMLKVCSEFIRITYQDDKNLKSFLTEDSFLPID